MDTNYYLLKKRGNMSLKDFMEIFNKYSDSRNELYTVKDGYLYKGKFYLKGTRDYNKLIDKLPIELRIGETEFKKKFKLFIYPELEINSLEDWEKLFDKNLIEDEYGNIVTKQEMLEIIHNGSKLNKEESNYELRKDWNYF